MANKDIVFTDDLTRSREISRHFEGEDGEFKVIISCDQIFLRSHYIFIIIYRFGEKFSPP